jgi:putative flippase GtrA
MRAASAPSSLLQSACLRHPLVQRLLASPSLIMQIGRYGLVSVAALGFDFAVFLALTKAGAVPAMAGMAGYAVGLVLHFLLSTLFVFDTHASRKTRARLFGEFAISGGAGLVLTAAVITVMTHRLHAAPVAAKITAVLISFVVVFLLRRSVVFAARRAPVA